MAVSQRTYKVATERLNKYLRANNLRPTKVRRMVLGHVCQLPQPFTAAQLVEACQEERISSASVYNCLDLFTLAQILHATKRQRGISVLKYELFSTSAVRMQVVCTKCGRVTEFHDKAISRLMLERKYTNFIPKEYSFLVYGECKVCPTRKKQSDLWKEDKL